MVLHVHPADDDDGRVRVLLADLLEELDARAGHALTATHHRYIELGDDQRRSRPAEHLDPDAAELPDEDHRRLVGKTKAAGLWCLGAPEEHGGGGLGTFAMCVLLEEMSQHRMGLYNPGCGVFGRNPPPVIWGGTKAQIARYAAPALREGYHTFFAITEPSGGSDPAGAIQSRGEKRGDHWGLNGTKMVISHAHEADVGDV